MQYDSVSLGVPPELQYNKLQLKAFVSQFREWSIQPIASTGQYWPGQIIKIFLNAFTAGVVDPYRSHIQITVSTNTDILPVGLVQVDNSAQSFIDQLIIQSKNRQIQRITQYGALAAYLTDMGLSQIYAQGRQTEGLGYTNLVSYPAGYAGNFGGSIATNTTDMPNIYGGQLQGALVQSPNTIFPTMGGKLPVFSVWGSETVPVNVSDSLVKGHMTTLNPCWMSYPEVGWWGQVINAGGKFTSGPASIAQYGYAKNLRAQYLFSHNSTKYIDSTSSCPNFQVRLNPNVFGNYVNPQFDRNSTIYETYTPTTLQSYMYVPGKTNPNSNPQNDVVKNVIQNSTNTFGFSNLFSPVFSKGTCQPFISPTVPQCQMQGGVILQTKIPIAQRTFKIPLISSVLGVLIPQDQFILIPLIALNDMLFQMTIDPYAMFTSGYNDIAQYDGTGMTQQQQRAFQIQRVSYKMHTYQFFNPQIDEYLKISLNSGIAINTNYWQLANQYQVQNSQSLTNAWPVACTQQALNQVVVLFYPLDYQAYSFCRKHFRISNNITKFQLRMNMQYFPPQPYQGNGGNPLNTDPFGDNSVYLQNIYFANNYMFSNLMPSPRINAYNFAINDRCYDPTNNSFFYDSSMVNNPTYGWNKNAVNADTALGMSFIHENRFVGKAAYVYSFQPYAHSANLLTGVNCRQTKNFEILFSSAPSNWFPRPQIMYIFTRSSNIIEYNLSGVINVNK